MAAATSKRPRSGFRRMLVATMAVTLLYIALYQLLVGGLAALYSRGMLSTTFQPRLDEEARQLAERSAALDALLTPRHRYAAWSLGVHLGSASQYVGSFGASEPGVQAQARAAVVPQVAAAQVHADFLGIGRVAPLDSPTAARFWELTQRIDADENGIGARIAERTTPRHRHLYLLGMHVGVALRSMQSEAWQGAAPASDRIARHATLAGVARAQWEPLARVPPGRTRAEVTAAYVAAAEALEKAIASDDFGAKR